MALHKRRGILGLVLLLVGLVWPASARADEPRPTFHGVIPARLLDTRLNAPTSSAFVAGEARSLQATGRAGIPAAGVGTVVLNVTLTEPTDATYMTVYAAGTQRPLASNVNVGAGETHANMVIAAVGVGGQISLYNNAGSVHVLVDIMGWFPLGDAIVGVTPARLLDTRSGERTVDGVGTGRGAVGPLSTVDLVVAGRGGVPVSGAAAVALNVTATEPTGASYVTIYPKNAGRPLASNLNMVSGQTTANMVVVPLGGDGSVTLYNNSGSTQLVVDVLAWFPVGSSFSGLKPARLLDTRPGHETADIRTGPIEGVIPLHVVGRGGVPSSGVGSVALNVTVTDANIDSFVSVRPARTQWATTSNVNYLAGQTVANMVIVPVDAAGDIWLSIGSGAVFTIVDVLGWFPYPDSYETVRVSTFPEGEEVSWHTNQPAASGDGAFVAFTSIGQVYVRNMSSGAVTLVSAGLNGSAPDGESGDPSISNNGRYVAFESVATDLVVDDTNGASDVFVRDTWTNTTRRASVSTSGAQGSGVFDSDIQLTKGSSTPSISGDGQRIAFTSYSPDLVADDTNGAPDIFLRDLSDASTARVSVDTAGSQAVAAVDPRNDHVFGSMDASISADGNSIAFTSWAPNLVNGDTNGVSDVFLRDLNGNTTVRVSVSSAGQQATGVRPGFDIFGASSLGPAVSANGRFVAFSSAATDLVPGDTNNDYDVFERDLVTGATTMVSVDSAGAPQTWIDRASSTHKFNYVFGKISISADGRYVAFATDGILGSSDYRYDADVFIHDRVSGETHAWSVDSNGLPGNFDSTEPSLSADGSFVAFSSKSTNLVADDVDYGTDAFVVGPLR